MNIVPGMHHAVYVAPMPSSKFQGMPAGVVSVISHRFNVTDPFPSAHRYPVDGLAELVTIGSRGVVSTLRLTLHT